MVSTIGTLTCDSEACREAELVQRGLLVVPPVFIPVLGPSAYGSRWILVVGQQNRVDDLPGGMLTKARITFWSGS